ncbi:MAG: hypothetical protein RRB13_10945 [bacterium]|nr:hypothetical protein [bacterium]
MTRLFVLVSLFVWGTANLWAQEMEFVPAGVVRFKVHQETHSYDRMSQHVRTTRSLLSDELAFQDLEDAAVSGDMTQSETRQVVDLSYGWSDFLNVGLVVPQVSRQRKSNLSYDPNDSQAAAFAASRPDAQSSGLGDVELYSWLRHWHNDYNLFETGFFYRHNTGAAHYDDASQLALGYGLPQVGARLAWDAYLGGSRIMFRTRIQMGYYISQKTQNEAGQEVTAAKANQNWVKSGINQQWGPTHWGLEMQYDEVSETSLDNIGLGDNRHGASLRFYLGAGSLRALESDPSTFPWMVEAGVTQAYWGTNLPMGNQLDFSMVLYF